MSDTRRTTKVEPPPITDDDTDLPIRELLLRMDEKWTGSLNRVHEGINGLNTRQTWLETDIRELKKAHNLPVDPNGETPRATAIVLDQVSPLRSSPPSSSEAEARRFVLEAARASLSEAQMRAKLEQEDAEARRRDRARLRALAIKWLALSGPAVGAALYAVISRLIGHG